MHQARLSLVVCEPMGNLLQQGIGKGEVVAGACSPLELMAQPLAAEELGPGAAPAVGLRCRANEVVLSPAKASVVGLEAAAMELPPGQPPGPASRDQEPRCGPGRASSAARPLRRRPGQAIGVWVPGAAPARRAPPLAVRVAEPQGRLLRPPGQAGVPDGWFWQSTPGRPAAPAARPGGCSRPPLGRWP